MILCADDYGLGEDIDRAILALCERQRLTAVSCMVVLRRCTPEALRALVAHQGQADIGLHLCLVDDALPRDAYMTGAEPKPYFSSYRTLLRSALLRGISQHDVFETAAKQYELFIRKCGRRPDYIDGHLHAHQLPVVRDGLIEFVQSLPPDLRPYIRNTDICMETVKREKLPWFKTALISRFGSTMRRKLTAANIRTNDGFSGIYDFKKWNQQPEYFPRFVRSLPERNGILVVHPGEKEDWRRQEFETIGRFPFAAGSLNRFSDQKR